MWGSDLSSSMQGAGGVGGLLEVSYHGSSLTNCFPAYDGNGNVSALVNAAGTVAANYEYGPFGEVIRATGPLAKINPIRFSTKYQDDESDLLYYGYRYYKASTGTWLSRDPLDEKAFMTFVDVSFGLDNDMNGYLFVQNNPISNADWLGGAVWNGVACFCRYACMPAVPVSNYDSKGHPNMDGGAICDASSLGATATRSGFHSACDNQPWIFEWCYNCSRKSCTFSCEYKCSKGKARGHAGYYWVGTGKETLISGCR